MAKKKQHRPTKATLPHKDSSPHISFTRINYILMIVGAVFLVIGYLLMGGGQQGGPEFNPEEIYHPMRITVAPILVVIGFVIEIIAIFYRPKAKEDTQHTKAG